MQNTVYRAVGIGGRQREHVPFPSQVNVPFFHFHKVRWWTVLLEEIFPIIHFSTGNYSKWELLCVYNNFVSSLNLSHLGCYNGHKLQSSWAFVPDHTWWVYRVPYSPRRFPLCEILSLTLSLPLPAQMTKIVTVW